MICSRTLGKMTAGSVDDRADGKISILAAARLNNQYCEALVNGGK